jgi:hypothetical protein
MRAGIVVGVAILLELVGPAPARSQSSADAGLETYQLTMPNVRKMATAYEKMDAALKANPALAAKLAKQEGASSVEEVIKRIDGEPVLRQAIAGAGISTRDLVLTQFATFTAGMNDFAVKSGAKPPTAPAAAANLRLYQQNRAEFDQLTARVKQLDSWKANQARDSNDGDSEDRDSE